MTQSKDNILSNLMDKLGRRRVITERDSNVPYLVRYYLFLKERKNFPFNLTLHKVLVSDEPTLHDHPWSYATFIIAGGYYENTPKGRFWRGPGHFRYRSANDLHFLELDKDTNGNEIPCWSLFFMGKKAGAWGFLKNGVWIHNENYLARGAKDE
jgi:hypothetical protein|tara:strand:+ start:623 stop:1084 length:462 start_codon:yes stop_codon:yes gene_type:complete